MPYMEAYRLDAGRCPHVYDLTEGQHELNLEALINSVEMIYITRLNLKQRKEIKIDKKLCTPVSDIQTAVV